MNDFLNTTPARKVTGENHANIDAKQAISRRSVVKLGAWSTPVIAMAAAAPARAASQTPSVVERRSSWLIGISYSNLDVLGRWQSSSTAAVSFQTSTDGPALALASNTSGLTAKVTQFAQTLTTPFRVVWSQSPGWSITETLSGPTQWTYLFTPDATVLPTNSNITVATPAGNFARNPATTSNSVPQGNWTGTAVTSTMYSSGFAANGRVMRGRAVNFPISVVRRYTVHYPSPWGDRPYNADGATSISVAPVS